MCGFDIGRSGSIGFDGSSTRPFHPVCRRVRTAGEANTRSPRLPFLRTSSHWVASRREGKTDGSVLPQHGQELDQEPPLVSSPDRRWAPRARADDPEGARASPGARQEPGAESHRRPGLDLRSAGSRRSRCRRQVHTADPRTGQVTSGLGKGDLERARATLSCHRITASKARDQGLQQRSNHRSARGDARELATAWRSRIVGQQTNPLDDSLAVLLGGVPPSRRRGEK